MAVNYYATEDEFKEKTARNFTATTPITTTQIKVLLEQLSAQLDGLMGEDEDNLGTSATAPEWAKQAVLSAAKMIVDAKYSDDIKTPSEKEIIDMLKSYYMGRDVDQAQPKHMHFFSDRPNASGDWD